MIEDPKSWGSAEMRTDLDRLVNQIGRLSTGQRRSLFRQLKAMGLIEAEELLSDWIVTLEHLLWDGHVIFAP